MKIVQENTGRKETEFDPEKREQETAGKISVRKKLYKNSRTDRKNKSVRLYAKFYGIETEAEPFTPKAPQLPRIRRNLQAA